MHALFRAEFARLRSAVLLYALAHALVVIFLSRVVDMLQQPTLVYQVGAAVHLFAGLLLGVWQLRAHHSLSAWMYLLHRPLSPWRVALGVLGAGLLCVVLAVALPMYFTLGMQRMFGVRVIDLRHWLLPLAGVLLALAGYFSGVLLSISPKGRALAPVAILGWLIVSLAAGGFALAVQLTGVLWLGALAILSFRPDTSEAPRHKAHWLLLLLPTAAAWTMFAPPIADLAFQSAWIAAGSHPLNQETPSPGGYVEASTADSRDLLLLALHAEDNHETAVLRGQIELSTPVIVWPSRREIPQPGQLTNLSPAEFDDEQGTRWVFSHDEMRFLGINRAKTARVEGLGNNEGFLIPPVLSDRWLLTSNELRLYDEEKHTLRPVVTLPKEETIAAPPETLEPLLLVLSDRALYFFDQRNLARTHTELAPRERLALPISIGNLARVDVLEVLHGYLVSFVSGRGSHDGAALGQQWLYRVEEGRASLLATRPLASDFPELFRDRDRWFAPALFYVCQHAISLFAAHNPLTHADEQATGPVSWVLAGSLSLLAALWTFLRARRARSSWLWPLGALLFGWPLALTFALLVPVPWRPKEQATLGAR